MDCALALANRRRTRGPFELGLAQFRDPQSGVNVVKINQAVQKRTVASYRAGLSAPHERQIRTEAFGVARPEACNFAALAVKVAAQFAGDVKHSRPAAV